MKSSKPVLLLCIIIFKKATNSLPNGAPTSACSTLLPVHGSVLKQTSVPPYQWEPTSSVVGSGQKIRLNLVASPLSLGYGGIILQAREPASPDQSIGRFLGLSDENTKLISCISANDTITHTSSSQKQGLSVEWEAPFDFEGEIIFNGTVAQRYDKFWVGIGSAIIKVVKRALPIDFASPKVRPATTGTPYPPFSTTVRQKEKLLDPIYDDCGFSKICFGIPNNCIDLQNCDAAVAVNVRSDVYQFHLESFYKNQSYVAVALSNDDKMGDDSVVECFTQNGNVEIRSSWTNPRPNLGVTREKMVPQNHIRIVSSSFVDGVIQCKFDREVVSSVKGIRFDLQTTPYHLLLAAGTKLTRNSVGYHDLGRLSSSQRILLSEVQNLSGASTLLVRLHGAFMVVAWIGTTSLGIVLARYFKRTWVGKQTCGKDQWFAWHRICMLTTWSLTMAAFVIIFVDLQDWSYIENPHAKIGVVTTILCFLQPIGALFRPDPSSKNRPLFNWTHWVGGNAAHILAVVTIFFAVKLEKAELPDWTDWILVAFVAFHVCMHFLFSIAGCSSDKEIVQRINSFAMTNMANSRRSSKTEQKLDAPLAIMRKILLFMYILFLLIFVVALVLLIIFAPVSRII